MSAPLANVQRRISINYQLWKIFTEIGAPRIGAPAPETGDLVLPSQTGCSHVYKILVKNACNHLSRVILLYCQEGENNS